MTISRTKLGIALLITTMVFIVSGKESSSMEKPAVNGVNNISEPISVVFYNFDKITGVKGGKVGSAKLENGKLSINTRDRNLEKLLKSEIIGKGGNVNKKVMPNGKEVFIGGMQIYKSGTKEHLESIINNAKAYGYYAEKQK